MAKAVPVGVYALIGRRIVSELVRLEYENG